MASARAGHRTGIAQERWGSLNLTIEEGLKELTTLCAIQVLVKGQPRCNQIPLPRPRLQQLLDLARVYLPQVLPCKGIHVATRKKLQENRKKR